MRRRRRKKRGLGVWFSGREHLLTMHEALGLSTNVIKVNEAHEE